MNKVKDKIPFYKIFNDNFLKKEGIDVKKLSRKFDRSMSFFSGPITLEVGNDFVHKRAKKADGIIKVTRIDEREMDYQVYAPMNPLLFRSSELRSLIIHYIKQMPEKDRGKTYYITAQLFKQPLSRLSDLEAHQDQFIEDSKFSNIEVHPEYLLFLILKNEVFSGGKMFLQTNTASEKKFINEEGTAYYGIKEFDERLVTIERSSGNGYFVEQPKGDEGEALITHGFESYFKKRMFGSMNFLRLHFEAEPEEGTHPKSLMYPLNRSPSYKTQIVIKGLNDIAKILYIILAMLLCAVLKCEVKEQLKKLNCE